MAAVLLADTRYSRLAWIQRLRRVPKIYGILSSILTTMGDSKLRIICDELTGIEGLTLRCLMYDGCVFELDIANARKALIDSRPSSSTFIGIVVDGKPRISAKFSRLSLPLGLLFSGEASYAMGGNRARRNPDFNRACLFSAAANLIGDGRPGCPRDGLLCVANFNALQSAGNAKAH